jgi:predicted dehydrogenase
MGVDVCWIADINKWRAQDMAKAFDIPLALGADELALATTADAVLIACPYGARAPYYEFLRERPEAIYVEKPVARSVAELERICELRPDYALAAGFLRRTDGATNIVKGLIEDEVFGKLLRVRSEFGIATGISSGGGFAKDVKLAGGGQLFESAIHNIDAVCYMAGIERAVARECRMEAEGGFDLHTEALFQLTDAHGQEIKMELLVTCFHHTRSEIELVFERACLSFSLFKKKPPTLRGIGGERSYRVLDAELADYPRTPYGLFYVFWTEFFSGLENRRPNYTSARSTWATASIVEQLYRAAPVAPALNEARVAG